jgi:glycyl-tRNA synthetase beta chain
MARQASIYEQAKELERIHDIRVELVPELVREVRDLTEYPRLLLASFEKRFLELPEFLVTTVLRSHQRCFPCFDRTGKLLPLFAFAASCLPEADDTVINGNRRVVRARLRDCEFFLASDRKRPLEAYLPELEAMTFQRELGDAGSIGAKAARLVRLAQQLELPEELTEAARLCKCDLATQTVFEFPELQGQVGAYLSGLEAIREHYLPLQLKGELPSSQAGAWLSVLDRADTIVALFSAGKVPSGSSDPYALRRQTLGMFSVLSEFRLDIAPKRILEMAASHLPDTQMEPLWSSGGLGEFCRQRLVYVLSYAYPRWSLDMLLHDVTCLERAVPTMLAELDSLLSCPQEDLESLVTAMQRLRRILKKQPLPGEIGELKEPAERRLWQVLEQLREEMPGHSMKWQLAAQVSQPVHEFFEQCLVEDPDDPGASASRKAMLGQLLETISHNLRYPDWDAW